jgi:zinc protease
VLLMFLTLLAATSLLSGVAHAFDIPDAPYRLQLDDYDIQIRDYRFPSGLRVMFQSESSQPIVAITAVIDRGSEHDQEGVDGIAHVVEHLAFRARHGDLPKNMDVIKQLGGSFNASTSVDWTNYMTVAPIDSMIPLLQIEAKRLKDGVANVTESDVRSEVEIARNELRMRYENAAVGAAWDELGRLLFEPGHPYTRSTIGSHDTLSNIDLPHVQEFVEDNYRPEYTTIVVVGDFPLDKSGDIWYQSFQNDMDLLMAPEDAAAYVQLETENERIAFLNEWFPKLESFMIAQKEAPPEARVQCGDREEPPMPQSQETATVSGMVDRDTVILGWSLPGAYCEDQPNMQVMANTLTQYVTNAIQTDWDGSYTSDVGCFVSAEEYFSQLICFIDVSASDYGSQRTVEKAADGLYRQWEITQPELQQFQQRAFSYGRSSAMAGVLQGVDLVSSISGGRATSTAMFTHFTGNAGYFSAQMEAYNTLDPAIIRDIAQRYITRDRMVSVIVQPMDVEERARREASAKGAKKDDSAAYHAVTEEDAFALLFDPESLTAEAIQNTTITPNLENMHEFTLDNGMRVGIMNYGEAPLIRVGLQVEGGNSTSEPYGINSLAEALSGYGNGDRQDLLAVAGDIGWANQNTITASGSSGNLDALLHKMRWYVEDTDWRMADKRSRINGYRSGAKGQGRYPETWASRLQYEVLFPNHVMGNWWRPSDYDVMEEWDRSMLEQWLYRKWQPANAELIIVGNVDPDQAEQDVRDFFGGWEARAGIDPTPIPDMPAPTELPERTIMIFDKPIATQSDITLTCQAGWSGDDENAQIQIVGEVLSEMIWRQLRENSGVTYGAYAYPRYYDGGTAMMGMASLVQNDAAGFAIQSMLDLVQTASEGNIDEGALATAKWSRARSYGLGQQSGEQMLSRLLAVDVGNFDYFDMYKQTLGNVGVDAFPEVLAPCVGHEVITVVGPQEYASAQLDELGIAYEVVDWEELYQGQLTKKELKKYLKAKQKAEEAEAEAAAAEAAEAAEAEAGLR